ncbi:MAG TPA: hypothetical protein VN887_17935 [Candidatus Angelobacter sp.]|nr:hypothetical protein [Candidatus Angelobacter sp.]
MMNSFSKIVFMCLLLALTGCTLTELRVSNRTGTNIYVYSGHTKRITTIKAGNIGTVPHSSGSIIVVTGHDDVWQFENVESISPEANRSFNKISLLITIGADGLVTLPNGKILSPSQILQGQHR